MFKCRGSHADQTTHYRIRPFLSCMSSPCVSVIFPDCPGGFLPVESHPLRCSQMFSKGFIPIKQQLDPIIP